MRKYINESHRNYSEALQKEIAEMSRNPLPAAEKEAQMRRNRQLSQKFVLERFSPSAESEIMKALRANRGRKSESPFLVIPTKDNKRAEKDRLKANDEFLSQFAGKWSEPETSEGED